MKKSLYKITLGVISDQEDIIYNFRSENIVAKDVVDTIKKCRLRKNEFVEEVVRIDNIDKL